MTIAESKDHRDVPQKNLQPHTDMLRSGTGLRHLIERFAALPRDEQERQIEATNQYLSSAAGQREFRHLLSTEAMSDDAAPEQGLH